MQVLQRPGRRTVGTLLNAVMGGGRRRSSERAARHEAAAAEHSRGELVAWVTGELRARLSAMRSSLDGRGNPGGEGSLIRGLELGVELDRVIALVDDLAALSASHTGGDPHVLAPARPGPLSDGAFDLAYDGRGGGEPFAELDPRRVVGLPERTSRAGAELHRETIDKDQPA